MTDGQVRVREGGEEAVVDAPSLNGAIEVDLDAGPTGGSTVFVPAETATLHREEMDADDEPSEARTDGGASAVTDRVTVRGTGLSEDHAFAALVAGVVCLLAGVSGSGAAAAGAIVGGLGLMYLGGRAYFTLRATGGDDA
ncbi:hypothetical protein [Halobaculum gomorrense]|uniref:Uncharacterized protein n=1 Tax=Halobaculum gomorrense TaxID=43928 RepID=A0A1M5MMQ7_9EURY|nr:hypothetical protein [Halobaculum gomorrense]SHG78063.1 hypothetical protein SAMN05443636_1053 [Halobaculum gomorrense]